MSRTARTIQTVSSRFCRRARLRPPSCTLMSESLEPMPDKIGDNLHRRRDVKHCVLGLIACCVLVPTARSQVQSQRASTAPCTVHIDLRWRKSPDMVMRGPTGEVSPDAVSLYVMNGAGKAYWDETRKNKYPGICLDADQPDYYVVWTWSQTAYAEGILVEVFAIGESDCLSLLPLFESSKVTNDQERSAKQAFKEALRFLATEPKPRPVPHSSTCISPNDWAPPNPFLSKHSTGTE